MHVCIDEKCQQFPSNFSMQGGPDPKGTEIKGKTPPEIGVPNWALSKCRA